VLHNQCPDLGPNLQTHGYLPVTVVTTTPTSAPDAASAGSTRQTRRINAGSSLLRKYVVSLVALVSVALLVSGLVGLYFTYEESKTARLNLQREKAEAAATRIDSYVKEIERQLGWMRLSRFGPAAADYRRLEHLKLLRQVPAITDVLVLDSTGREQLRVSRLGMDVQNSAADRSAAPAFQRTRRGETYYSDVYFRNDSEPYITMAVAGVEPEGGEVTVAEINLKFIWDVISGIRIGQQGIAYLVDARGHLIAHPDMSQALQKTDLSHLAYVSRAVAGDPIPVTLAPNVRGNEALIAHAAIRPLGWHVFVEQPLSEALAPLYASLQRTGLLLMAGLLLALGVSIALARRMVTPIRAIQAGAARIASGKLDQRISVRTGDELQSLAAEFNNMAQQLRESYTHLEHKVEERTRELRQSLEQQTATAEILQAISSSPTDLAPVLNAVAEKAARLCGADHVVVRLIQDGQSRVAAEFGDVNSSASGAEAVVPLIRDAATAGAIVVRRRARHPFDRAHMQLLETFAAQVVIALENVRMFREIDLKTRELERANRHKSEFLANVSHELRTPLNAIIGFSDVLRERMFGELNEKQFEYVEDIHESGKHLLSLINDILNLAKIEAGRMDLELSSFDLEEAIRSAASLIRDRAVRSGITLDVTLAAGLSDWVADERKFKQIMLNLLSNAVKFTPRGGSVRVAAARSQDGLEVSVADTGVGIAPHHLDMIFDEFRQLGSDNAKHDGTGLGLPLTRRLVELHGGTMQVRSRVGEGSTFVFTLPEKRLATV